MRLCMGIDGGGSGCRAVLTDAADRVLGRGAAGPANIRTDFRSAFENIIAAARQAAGTIPFAEIDAGLGLAGAGDTDAARRLCKALPFARAVVATDAVTSALGALGDDDGIVAALGTGSVYLRRDRTGIRQIGGRGFAIGDEAGGAWLGRRAVAYALRAADGIEAASPFLGEVLERFGGVSGAVAWAARASAADFAALAPVIAASSDPVAQQILAEASCEIDAAITALQPDPPLSVVLIGGLAPFYVPRISPHWHLRPARGTSLDGALRLARMDEEAQRLWRAD